MVRSQVVCFTLNKTNWQAEVYISELALVSKANYSVPPWCGAGHDIIYISHIDTSHSTCGRSDPVSGIGRTGQQFHCLNSENILRILTKDKAVLLSLNFETEINRIKFIYLPSSDLLIFFLEGVHKLILLLINLSTSQFGL